MENPFFRRSHQATARSHGRDEKLTTRMRGGVKTGYLEGEIQKGRAGGRNHLRRRVPAAILLGGGTFRSPSFRNSKRRGQKSSICEELHLGNITRIFLTWENSDDRPSHSFPCAHLTHISAFFVHGNLPFEEEGSGFLESQPRDAFPSEHLQGPFRLRRPSPSRAARRVCRGTRPGSRQDAFMGTRQTPSLRRPFSYDTLRTLA